MTDCVSTLTTGEISSTELVRKMNVTPVSAYDTALFNDSSLNDTELPGHQWPLWIRTTVIPSFFGFVCLLGIIGNGVVIAVLLRFTNMRTVPNIYIVNLAFADLLFMLSMPFLAYQYAANNWIFGKAICKIVFAVDGMNMFTGIFILTAMSIDRYFAIVHGITSIKYRTVRNARIVNCCLWCLSIIVTLPLWMYSSTFDIGSNRLRCDVIWPIDIFKTYFAIFTFFMGFALPITIISCCYLRLLVFILRTKGPRSENPRKSTGSRRVALLVITVVMIFVVCWLPFYVVQFVLLYSDPTKIPLSLFVAYYASLCLSYANSSLNPIVYTFAGENFRKNLRRICLRRAHRKIQRSRHRVVRKGLLQKASSRMNWTSLTTFSVNDSPKYGNTLSTPIDQDTTTTTESFRLTTHSETDH
ncbi:somatostatin receptor type 5-like [Glandiceps talaboti]